MSLPPTSIDSYSTTNKTIIDDITTPILSKQPSTSSIIEVFRDGNPDNSAYGYIIDFDDEESPLKQQKTTTNGSRNSLAISVKERRKMFECVEYKL